MIAICIGIFNRTSQLLEYLISSMNACDDHDQLVLSIYDCKTSDVKDLEGAIRQMWNNTLTFKSENTEFSRSHAFNQAVRQSNSNKIFVCDADMTLPIDFVAQYNKHVASNTVWFPICYSLFRNKRREIANGNGWWRGEGHGMVGILKENFELLGGYKLNFDKWGGEDDDFFIRAHRHFKVIRNKCWGLFHNWHPPDQQWGGRDVCDDLDMRSEGYIKMSKDLMSRSRGIFLNYIHTLIVDGRSNEARNILYRNLQYARSRRWWKLWIESWIPQWLMKHLFTK
jgi:predicted glycosyltransferase involved in capsule biosynthesis